MFKLKRRAVAKLLFYVSITLDNELFQVFHIFFVGIIQIYLQMCLGRDAPTCPTFRF